MYGYAARDKTLELVTFRVRAELPVGRVELDSERLPPRAGPLAPAGTRKVYFEAQADFVDCPVYDRALLRPGDRRAGPAIVEQMDCTAVVPPDVGLRVDDAANLILTLNEAAP